MDAVQSFNRSPKEKQQHVSLGEGDEEPDVDKAALVERMKRAVVNTLPKT
jgi:hypothetical protein